MPYFFFGPSFFHTYTCSIFDVFLNMKLSTFLSYVGILSLLILKWIGNALFFGHFGIITLGVIIFTLKKLLEILYFSYYRWLENHQVDAGLLSENEYTIQRRKDVCAQMIKLEKQGYYVVYLDES